MECPNDGGRLASSLGPVSMLNALTTTLRPIVKLPVGPYLEAMHCIEAAGSNATSAVSPSASLYR